MSNPGTTPLAFCDATEVARRIKMREISASECLAYFLDRNRRFNERINALVVLDEERARKRAAEADAALARGENWGSLHGVPMTLKESFDVHGLPTTFGDPALKDRVAQEDADVAKRLRAAGAIIFAKTNVPLGLKDFQTHNTIYGTTNNPWDTTRGPGGSSGGEGAALAAGLSAAGFGSDIGGSIRNPAHYCGVYGHKPTYGTVSTRGHAPLPRAAAIDLSVCGPLARSARDLRLMMDVTAGPDSLLGGGQRVAFLEPNRALAGLRVAVWATDTMAPVAREVAQRCRGVAQALSSAGAEVSDTARPDFRPKEAYGCYVKLLQSALSTALPQGVFDELRKRAAAFDPRDTSKAALAAWDAIMPHRTWMELHEERCQLRLKWRTFFERWDLLVCPISPTAAFPHDSRPYEERHIQVDGEDRPYFQSLFWAGLATASYLPSTVIPTGTNGDALPIGVQLIGPEYGDHRTIAVASQLEDYGYIFRPPPAFAAG